MIAKSNRLSYLMPIAAIAVIFSTLALMGCDGKLSASYQPPMSFGRVSLSMDSDGQVSCGVGTWTPVGVFSINYAFASDSNYSYVTIRNRKLGTDQVFKLARAESIELDTHGEHRIILTPNGNNKWIIETETFNGMIDLKIHYFGAEVARIDFGEDNPTISVMSDKRLVYRYPGWFSRKHELPTDSIQSICLVTGMLTRQIVVTWKPSIQQERLVLPMSRSDKIPTSFTQLHDSLILNNANIDFKSDTCYAREWGVIGFFLLFLAVFCWIYIYIVVTSILFIRKKFLAYC